jgi:hypothetical protein
VLHLHRLCYGEEADQGEDEGGSWRCLLKTNDIP